MRLAEFILANREPILAEWETFARTCKPASGSMNIAALRDHANEMLTVIAADLNTPQDKEEQQQKSEGNAPATEEIDSTAAEHHGAGRAESGFSVDQMVAEFRALRASVIRLWTEALGGFNVNNIEDLTRFNEAIDQSLAESVSRYTDDLDTSKEMFLAMLGHDLRSPLSAIIMSAEFMLETGELTEPHLSLTSRVSSSAHRMEHMIGDLLDFTRSRLGGGIPIERAEMSIEKAVHDVVDEIAAAHPDRVIKIDARGGHKGSWDCERISQVLSNLIGNAVEHGEPGGTIEVTVAGDDKEVTVAVHNLGAPIPPEQLNGLFGPMKAKDITGSAAGPSGNLGLGLYIAERIVSAHGGTMEVDSSKDAGTTFTVHLPRVAAADMKPAAPQ
ncbi:MAG TPA: sensor histidine kinase [Gemmatimonadaceae bacterium]|nr:sensor histidine kinase [Gemmatimonadaceae bacterium]